MNNTSKKRNNDDFYEERPLALGTQSCDIMLYRRKNVWPLWDYLMHEGIYKFTNGIVFHAAIKGKDGDIIEARDGRIRKTKIEETVDKDLSLLIFRKPGLSDELKRVILAYAYGSVGRDYDSAVFLKFMGIGGVQLDPDKDFCSENVARGYANAGLPISDKEPGDTPPQMLLDYQCTKAAKDNGFVLIDSQNINLTKVEEFQRDKLKDKFFKLA